MGKKNRTEPFLAQMIDLLGPAEAPLLLDVLQFPAMKSVRYNATKCSASECPGIQVPWCADYGRYWDNAEFPSLPSRTIEYAAGSYYIQEASAMLAVSVAARVIHFAGKTVLDLCAAPGGKTTQAAELTGNGFVLANEVIGKRVDALIWNVNRHRLHNVIITSLTSERLARMLPGFFDIVIVDAPCSGEGLFQRQKNSPLTWSVNHVKMCARRQNAILTDAQHLLKPGGYLVYSTCTFSKEENEEQILFLLEKGLTAVPLPGIAHLPVSAAITDDERVASCSRRIFPHRQKGAGAFVSLLQKPVSSDFTSATSISLGLQGKVTLPLSELLPFLEFAQAAGFFYDKNGIISYFSQPVLPVSLAPHIIQLGAPLLDKRRGNEIMFGAVQFPAPAAILPLDSVNATAYMQGKEIVLKEPDGYYFVSYNNMVLGPVKITGGHVVNKMPRPLQATH